MTFDFELVRSGGLQLRAGRYRGKDDGSPPILFLNGIGADIETIEPFAHALGRELIAFDPPGIGGSPDPLLPYALPPLSGMLPDLLATFGHSQADVLGFSWGGALAQQFALQFPKATRRLMLVAASHGITSWPGDPAALLDLTDPRALMRSELRDADGLDERATGHIPQRRPIGFACQLAALTGWTSAPFLPSLSCPTLILSGARDRIVPAVNARILATLIPHAQQQFIADAGHLLLWTHRSHACDILRSFLDEAEPVRARR